MPDTDPCPCWTRQPALPHAGHCCFGFPDPDGDVYQRGQAPPCGHWHPDVPRPRKFTNDQAHAWIGRRCIACLTKPTSAGRYRCNTCHHDHLNQKAEQHA
ncbi:hypothetical protein [Mycolicibacterium goodii]|uniref:hypothetical protein n=1 Tax=Mycolicibacterium goodii TaxID=134601 RepID=UPI001BDD4CC5|nr:hypothetical protein [Mycolicibacterium goodii]MBU8830863.1 hypothetical protein [Mycolicibacterium goodii]